MRDGSFGWQPLPVRTPNVRTHRLKSPVLEAGKENAGVRVALCGGGYLKVAATLGEEL